MINNKAYRYKKKQEEIRHKCGLARTGIESKVKLSCSNATTKDELILAAIKNLILRKPCPEELSCPLKKELNRWESVILDCNCKWINEARSSNTKPNLYYTECPDGHPLSSIDFCLVNKSVPFKFVLSMLDEYPKKEKIRDDIANYILGLEKEEPEVIADVVPNTNLLKKERENRFVNGSANFKVSIEILKVSKKAETYYLNKMNLKENEVQTMVQTLQSIKRIKKLYLENCSASIEGIEMFSNLFRGNSSLQQLELNNSTFSDEGIIIVSNALKQNRSITRLSIAERKISGEGLRAISELLKVNKTIKELILSNTGIYDDGAELLVKALTVNKKLVYLDLDTNTIRDRAAKAFARILKTSRTFTELILTDNPLTGEAIEHLRGIPNKKVKVSIERSFNFKPIIIRPTNAAIYNSAHQISAVLPYDYRQEQQAMPPERDYMHYSGGMTHEEASAIHFNSNLHLVNAPRIVHEYI